MRTLIIALLLALTTSISAKAPLADLSQEVQQVLVDRDSYYHSILGEGSPDSLLQRGSDWKVRLGKSKKRSLWPLFLTGIANSQSESAQNNSFGKALSSAGNNRAQLWVLFIEFIRINNSDWAMRTLIELDKANQELGIFESPFMAQQLSILASQAYAQKNTQKTKEILDYATYVTQNHTPLMLTQIALGGTPHNDIFSLWTQFVDNLKQNTQTQFFVLTAALRLLIIVMTVFFVLAFITLAFQTITKAVHFIACKFPHTVPYTIRLIFTAIIIIALATMGPYPIFLLLLMLMGTFIKIPALKVLFIGALITGLLFPFTSSLTANKLKRSSQRYPLGLYMQALNQAPTQTLADAIEEEVNFGDHNAMEKSFLYNSLALVQLKTGNLSRSSSYINQAINSESSSEPALLGAGVIYKGRNKLSEAEKAFKLAVDTYPLSSAANFNYGQFSLQQANTIDGNNHISIATTAYSTRFNPFLAKNSTYYSNRTRPLTRQFIIGDVSPNFYWSRRADIMGNTATVATALWGSSSLGLPPIAAVLLLIILGLIIKASTASKKKRTKITPCPLCGKPTCQHCREELCHDCNTALSPITNKDLITTMKIKLSNTKKMRIRFRGQIANMIVPGTRELHIKGTMSWKSWLLFAVTVFVYSGYTTLWSHSFTPFVIPQLTKSLSLYLTIPLVLYNTFFVVNFIKTARKEHHLGKK